jgi:anti-sigma B factor antagonist
MSTREGPRSRPDPPGGFRADLRWKDRTAWVEVEGEIDLSTAPRLKKAVDEALERGPERLVVDLSCVSFMDSSGLSSLLSTRQVVESRRCPFVVYAPSAVVERVLSITGLLSALRVEYPAP